MKFYGLALITLSVTFVLCSASRALATGTCTGLNPVNTAVEDGDTVDSSCAGLRLKHGALDVTVDIQPAECRILANSSANDYFVPARTMPEWMAFLNNLPLGVTATSCAVNGACGAANGVAAGSAPASGLCTAGTASAVSNNGSSWLWSCMGSNGGTNASCSAPIPQNGLCGAANGAAMSSAPASGLCTAGTASAVANNGSSWLWSCAGTYGAATASCSAPFEAAENGQCGPSNGVPTASVPGGLCAAGTASGVSNDGSSWLWSCSGGYGGTTAGCSAPYAVPVNGQCGPAQGMSYISAPWNGLCNSGTPSGASPGGPGWVWTCYGANGGADASCWADHAYGTR